jgi:UMF1 family MFS transporter
MATPTDLTATLNDTKVVRAWYMYDWANSVYSLVIVSAIFPVYFKEVARTGDSDMVTFLGFNILNSNLFSYALSFSFLVVAAILPLLSGMADYAGKKKMFMKVFAWGGALSCMGLFLFTGVETLWLGILFSITASIGYSGSLVFYDAFLPEVVTEDRYDIASARGYSMGYYGSVLMLIICLVMIMNYEAFGLSNGGQATRVSFLLVGAWWIGFSMIPFKYLPDNPFGRKPSGNLWTKGYEEIRKVWKSLATQPNLKRFLIAYFFYNMGVQTVMYLAALYGTDVVHLGDTELIATMLLVQLVGAAGAYLFARVSATAGNKSALLIMIGIWIAICLGAYFVETPLHFYILAAIVGLVMGGIQSLSRATYSKLIPRNTIDHASYFSFYDVMFNLSIVFGTFSYGFINQIMGSMRYSALALAVYFVVGLVLLVGVRGFNCESSIVNRE